MLPSMNNPTFGGATNTLNKFSWLNIFIYIILAIALFLFGYYLYKQFN